MPVAPAPLFRDPIYDGAADPSVIYNRQEDAWWIFYTQRRANVDAAGVAYCHATDIGMASSSDGLHWRYRGVAQNLEFEKGRNTFWAPEGLYFEGTYHMYVSYVPGASTDWSGKRFINHYTSSNLWDWHWEAVLPFSSERVIDPCVERLDNGTWRLWYKDEADRSRIYAADSLDLYRWTVSGPAHADTGHEAPNVFRWHGYYWMLTDTGRGLRCYRFANAEAWIRMPDIMNRLGKRPDDGWMGQHADVVVQGEEAFIFYFVHPQRHTAYPERVPGVEPYETRRSSVQVARLSFDGETITCDRDEEFGFCLRPPV
jgi:hypothetical protein